MKNNSVRIIGTIVVGIIIIFVFLTLIEKNAPAVTTVNDVTSSSTPLVTPTTDEGYLTYDDPSGDFSISYPSDFVSSASTSEDMFKKGISFLFPKAFSDKTNLGQDSRVYIVKNSTAKNCTADEFIDNSYYNGQPAKQTNVTINGKTYSTLMTSDAGAGNFYETVVYTVPNSKPCYGVELFLHSSNIGNYTPGTVKEFDREKILTIFDNMLASFTLKK